MQEEKKYHLNWDNKQKNGIIFNDEYTWGALFVGEEHRPKLSFDYTDFNYGNVSPNHNYYTDLDGKKHKMTDEQEQEIDALIRTWKQASGQEGNMNAETTATSTDASATDGMTEKEVLQYLHELDTSSRRAAMENLAKKYGLPFENIEHYYETNKPA